MTTSTPKAPKRYVLSAAQLLKHARPVELKYLSLIPPTTALFEVREHSDRIEGQVVVRPRPWEKQERRLHDPPPPESARRWAEDEAALAAGKRFLEKRVKELDRRREASGAPPPTALVLPEHVTARDVPVRQHRLETYDCLTRDDGDE